jgi:hypothetical protein
MSGYKPGGLVTLPPRAAYDRDAPSIAALRTLNAAFGENATYMHEIKIRLSQINQPATGP